MDRQQAYRKFWQELADKAVERSELRSIHEKMRRSINKNDQYLQAREDGILYQYNIWCQKEDRACAYICDASGRESEGWIEHGMGRLQNISSADWAVIQDNMIDAMIKMARERGLA